MLARWSRERHVRRNAAQRAAQGAARAARHARLPPAGPPREARAVAVRGAHRGRGRAAHAGEPAQNRKKTISCRRPGHRGADREHTRHARRRPRRSAAPLRGRVDGSREQWTLTLRRSIPRSRIVTRLSLAGPRPASPASRVEETGGDRSVMEISENEVTRAALRRVVWVARRGVRGWLHRHLDDQRGSHRFSCPRPPRRAAPARRPAARRRRLAPMLIGFEGGAAGRWRAASRDLARRLRDSGLFVFVSNGDLAARRQGARAAPRLPLSA